MCAQVESAAIGHKPQNLSISRETACRKAVERALACAEVLGSGRSEKRIGKGPLAGI